MKDKFSAYCYHRFESDWSIGHQHLGAKPTSVHTGTFSDNPCQVMDPISDFMYPVF